MVDREAEDEKLAAEIDKLRAEARVLEWKEQGLVRWVLLLKDFFAVPAVVATLVFGVITFADQQREKHRFNVTSEVIQLVQKLHSSDRSERAGAAILLSAYGEHASPLLLSILRDYPKEIDTEVVTALTLLADRDPESVLEPLVDQSDRLFQKAASGDRSQVQALNNHIMVLANLASARDDSTALGVLQAYYTRLRCSEVSESQPQPGVDLGIVDRRSVCLHLPSFGQNPD